MLPLVGAIRGIGLHSPLLATSLLIAPGWWFWYCAKVLRLRAPGDWLRAFATVPNALLHSFFTLLPALYVAGILLLAFGVGLPP